MIIHFYYVYGGRDHWLPPPGALHLLPLLPLIFDWTETGSFALITLESINNKYQPYFTSSPYY